MKVVKGSKITKKAAPYYIELSNAYANLEKFSDDPCPTNTITNYITKTGVAKQPSNIKSWQKRDKKQGKRSTLKD